MIAIFPGSFDPFHLGHYDIMVRAAKIFDKVVVVALTNSQKKSRLDVKVKRWIIERAINQAADLDRCFNIFTYTSLDEPAVTVAMRVNAGVIVRGVRPGDISYEAGVAQANMLIGNLDTVWLPTAPEYSWMSSTLAYEIAKYGKGEIMVPWVEDWGFLNEPDRR